MQVHNTPAFLNKKDNLTIAAENMEEIFVDFLLQAMRKATPSSGGFAEELYTSLLDSELAKQIAQEHRFGIADMLIDSLKEPYENK